MNYFTNILCLFHYKIFHLERVIHNVYSLLHNNIDTFPNDDNY